MKLIILITVVESLLLVLWMAYSHYRRQQANALRQHSSTTNRVRGHSLLMNAAHWSAINKAQLEGQRDDRQQMNGSVATSEGPAPSARRSFARKSHQLMYKKWSNDRHE